MPIVTLPNNFTSTIVSYIGQLFTDFAPLIELIVGIVIGVIVIEVIVGLLRK